MLIIFKKEIQDKRECLHDGVLLNIGEEQRNITYLYTRSKGRGRRTNVVSLNRRKGKGKYNNGLAYRFGLWNGEVLSIMTYVYAPYGIFQTNKSDRPIQRGGKSRARQIWNLNLIPLAVTLQIVSDKIYK